MPRLLALALLLLSATGCVSAEVRERCPNWSLTCGCYCGPGGAWSGTGPARPKPTVEDFLERQYPTTVRIVDGRVLHPSTGKPVNCELMAPFESRVPEFTKPLSGWTNHWHTDTLSEIAGAKGYWLGVGSGEIRQGVAMSRACRGAETNRNEVTIGMTTDQVLATWGRPKSINEITTAAGKSEQWAYETGQRLDFENGVLRTIQRSR